MYPRQSRRCQTEEPTDTEAIAEELAESLRPGDVVVVQGEMGAGKTTFVRGASRALGVSAVVNSPTFTIGQRYPAPTPVAHLDLFRIESLADEEPDLLSDYIDGETISFVELPPGEKRLGDLERSLVSSTRIAAIVRLTHAGGNLREVEVDA